MVVPKGLQRGGSDLVKTSYRGDERRSSGQSNDLLHFFFFFFFFILGVVQMILTEIDPTCFWRLLATLCTL